MKKFLIVLMVAALAAASQASVLVYESFSDTLNENDPLNGYSGVIAETGLSDTWSYSGSKASLKVRTPGDYAGIAGGYQPNAYDGKQRWVEHNNSWSLDVATRSLSSTIDLTVDGTFYMSFFSSSGNTDYLAQTGLSDGSMELMFGNAYKGNNNGQGLTAYYNDGSNVRENGDGITNVNYSSWTTGFYVAEFIKSNSGDGDDLAISLKWYNLGTRSAPTNNDLSVADATRAISLTGVSSVFDTLQLKLDGSGNYPSIDEIRVGQTWGDVTGVPEPATLALLGIGSLALLCRKK